MKTYEIALKPLSAFGTPLKGDTIFGQVCWQVSRDDALLGAPLEALLGQYDTRPFAVFSSAVPSFVSDGRRVYLFKTPSLPPEHLFDLPDDRVEKIRQRKLFKSRKWMVLEEGKALHVFSGQDFRSDKELRDLLANGDEKSPSLAASQSHNTINRLTGRTGEGGFAPYTVEQEVFGPSVELVIFVIVDSEAVSIDGIALCLKQIGETGFGKDASTGLGRFDIGTPREIDLMSVGSKTPTACYTLGPCVPERDAFGRMFFAPFTRFGKHGDVLAKSANPFKNPVIMADEGAVLIPKSADVFEKPFVGSALKNLSKAHGPTIAQGYSPYLPVSIEV